MVVEPALPRVVVAHDYVDERHAVVSGLQHVARDKAHAASGGSERASGGGGVAGAVPPARRQRGRDRQREGECVKGSELRGGGVR